MRVHTLIVEQHIKRPLLDVFSFFENPRNLALITPPNMHFKIVTPGPLVMKVGITIDYTLSIVGVPLKWRSLISLYDPPHAFVDEQVKGPYKVWSHRHVFIPSGENTLVRDEVTYSLPFDVGGLVHRLMVKPQLQAIFDYRRARIEALLPASEVAQPPQK